MSDKPIREWWICLKKMEYAGFYYAEDKEKQPDLYPHYCHVIEAEPVLARIAKLEEELSTTQAAASIHADEHRKARARIDTLEVENAELKRSYDHYAILLRRCSDAYDKGEIEITRLKAQLEKCKWQRNCCGGLYKDDIAFYDAEIESIK